MCYFAYTKPSPCLWTKKLYLAGEVENLWNKPHGFTQVSGFGAGWLLNELMVSEFCRSGLTEEAVPFPPAQGHPAWHRLICAASSANLRARGIGARECPDQSSAEPSGTFAPTAPMTGLVTEQQGQRTLLGSKAEERTISTYVPPSSSQQFV